MRWIYLHPPYWWQQVCFHQYLVGHLVQPNLFYHKSYEWQTSDRQRHKKRQLDKIMTLGLWISPCCGAGSGYIKNECPEICDLQNFRAVYGRMLSKLCRTSHHRRSPRPYSYTRIAVWICPESSAPRVWGVGACSWRIQQVHYVLGVARRHLPNRRIS